MISRLSGKIVFIGSNFVVLDIGGVGYKVFCGEDTAFESKENSDLVLWTYQAVRENAIDLYGFKSRRDLNFFELLLSVSGIGPKTALSILNIASVENLQQAVVSGDTAHLTKVSGIGKKNAEKIILELKDRIGTNEETADDSGNTKGDGDVIDALIALGYSQNEARESVRSLPKDLEKTEERVREALRKLNS